MSSIEHFTEWVEKGGGTAMYAPLPGVWHSSTRAGLAALVMAVHIDHPIHIGIDNKTVVDKANKLIKIMNIDKLALDGKKVNSKKNPGLAKLPTQVRNKKK